MTEKNDNKYLTLDGVGESPLPEYPGTITFPHVMTLPLHKTWQAFVNGRADRDESDPRVGVAFIDDGAAGDRVPFLYDDVELALMFGKLELSGPNGKPLKVKSIDDLPLPVAVWIARCYREWETSQMFFRWNGVAGVAAPDGAE